MELGAAMIECDLQLTADGHVVVFHDWTVDRTSDGTGTLRELSLDTLRALDAGAWKDARFAGERIPTLAEVLDATAGRVELNLELKSRGGERLLALSSLAAVEAAGALGRVLFSSFDMDLLARLREASPTARIAVLWHEPDIAGAFAHAAGLGAEALHPWEAIVAPGLVAEAHGRGLAVNAWTVNPVERMLDLVGMGIDGIISDHPGRLLEARARLLAPGTPPSGGPG